MKANIFTRLSCVALIAGAVCNSAVADEIRFLGFPGSKLRIDGTSTIHDWHADTKLIGGSFRCDSAVSLADTAKVAIGKLDAKVAAIMRSGSFSCSSGSAMDKVMRSAMNTDKFPLIKFGSTGLEVKGRNADGSLNVAAKGDLEVSGVKKPISFDVKMVVADGGKRVTFSGSTKVKMTDFGIKPPAPSIGLGLIKTGDDVTLSFEWKTVRRD